MRQVLTLFPVMLMISMGTSLATTTAFDVPPESAAKTQEKKEVDYAKNVVLGHHWTTSCRPLSGSASVSAIRSLVRSLITNGS
jgi:hypothetical protein